MSRDVVLTVVLCAAQAFAGAPGRPSVDVQAMREAMGDGDTGVRYPSAASYAHFLRARLFHHNGDHRKALDELRLALASDDQSPYLLTEIAEEYARLSDLDRAEAQLKKVIEIAPDYAPAQLMMGRVLYESQKSTRAKGYLTRAIRLRPNEPDAYLVLTQLWLDQGKVDEAMKVVEELGAAVPGEPIGYRRLGLALAERGDLSRAEKLLLRAVDRDPGDFESWVALAGLYERQDRLKEAGDAYGRALERDPENREVLLSAGRLALRMNEVPVARAYFDQLLSLSRDPEQVVKVAFSFLAARQVQGAAEVLDSGRRNTEEPRLHFYAGLVHERLHEWSRAADAFQAVPKESGDLFHEARLHRAICLSSEGQHKAALELFKKIFDERPGVQGLDAAWARACERAGQPSQAEALLLRAMTDAPSNETYDAVIGFYARQGRPQEAASLFFSAVGKSPADQALLFALASALERKGEWQRAVETMQRVLAKDSANAAAMNFIGYTLADHGGDLEEAERHVRKALESRPDSAAFLDSLGWVLFKKGDLEHAIDALVRATQEAPDEPTLLEHLGDAQMKAGHKDKALEAWGHARRLLTENPDGAERPSQRLDLDRKLKALPPRPAGR